jgi:hypothetical protein
MNIGIVVFGQLLSVLLGFLAFALGILILAMLFFFVSVALVALISKKEGLVNEQQCLTQ